MRPNNQNLSSCSKNKQQLSCCCYLCIKIHHSLRYERFCYLQSEFQQLYRECRRLLLSYQVNGLILTDSQHTQRTLQMIKNAGVLVVETMELPELPIDMALTRSKGFKHKGWSITAIRGALQFKQKLKPIGWFGIFALIAAVMVMKTA